MGPMLIFLLFLGEEDNFSSSSFGGSFGVDAVDGGRSIDFLFDSLKIEIGGGYDVSIVFLLGFIFGVNVLFMVGLCRVVGE